MAVDEVLLRGAAEEERWALRFYSWSAPTLSLGYFQRWEDRQRHPASLTCDCVRRSSGGGAILHDRELTYSLAVPPNEPLAASAEGLYRRVHQSLVTMLRQLGIEAELYAATRPPAPVVADEPFLCFERRALGDVIVAGAKVAGSAQRRWRGAVLQHGSILLARSPWAPELSGLEEVRNPLPDSTTFAAQWRPNLAELLEIEFSDSEIGGHEVAEARQLASAKYQAASWNRRR